MSNVHFVDTSVFVELLNIPSMNEKHGELIKEYKKLAIRGDVFVLPVAVLVETGNHIAHVSDGTKRRDIAVKFTDLLKKAVNSEDNWNIAPELSDEILSKIIESFPGQAQAKIGFGDTSIVEQFEDYWKYRQPIGHMRIWSLDNHLAAYDKDGGLSRRKNQ